MSEDDNLEIIEEKIGNTNIPFSEVFNLYAERILNKGEDNLFKDNDLIKLNMEEKNKFKTKGHINIDLIYDGELVYFPIRVNFKKGDINKTYKMFTKRFFDKIYEEMNFKNPMLLLGKSYEDYNKNNLFTKYNADDKIYKIFEKYELNYSKFYSTEINLFEKNCPLDLTPNFNYYFSYPKKKCEMEFSFTISRKREIDSLFNFKTKKINSIFGPYGNGKTTSLILESRSHDNTCYLNLDALYKYKDDLYFWKYNLFLNELYNIFKKEEEKSSFKKIQEKILLSNNFWEAIYLSIEFCIENKIDSIFILDQYKEEIDPEFSQFKKIKNLINNEKNIYVKLVVAASSTNNSDLRDFIIKKYVEKLSKQELIIDYIYTKSLFKLTDIEGLIDILPESKKKLLEEYFSNIPSYFYIIYESNEDINIIKKEIKK